MDHRSEPFYSNRSINFNLLDLDQQEYIANSSTMMKTLLIVKSNTQKYCNYQIMTIITINTVNDTADPMAKNIAL